LKDGRILKAPEIEQFIETGWVLVREAFPRAAALAAQSVVWDALEKHGVDRAGRGTWTQPLIHLRENYRTPEFDACDTERLADAIEDLVGAGRFAQRGKPVAWGWWPVNFSVGADREWDVPTEGWHWDGIHFRHFLDSPEQGLLCLCHFSEVGPRGGGTLVAEGTHQVVARYLATKPKGVELNEGIREVRQAHPWLRDLTGGDTGPGRVERFLGRAREGAQGERLRVAETQVQPGDVSLCHPFLFHAASQNHSGRPRFMCNRTTPLRERMRFDRPDPDDFSPLEISILRAIAREDGRAQGDGGS
jgi:hypothetical protein